MADGSTKPIAELKVGDLVEGRGGINRVLAIPVRTTDEALYHINDSTEAFVTAEHMFYTSDGLKSIDPEATYRETINHVRTMPLKIGDVLFNDKGDGIRVTSIVKFQHGNHTLYNPEISNDHTYYANGYLVHNPLK